MYDQLQKPAPSLDCPLSREESADQAAEAKTNLAVMTAGRPRVQGSPGRASLCWNERA